METRVVKSGPFLCSVTTSMIPGHINLMGSEVILMPNIIVFLAAENVESMNAINVLSLARLFLVATGR